jgi:glycerol-1-phosphate dehydrogenase [NAD(P)+]
MKFATEQEMSKPTNRFTARQVSIPSLVRMKPAALDRIGIYLARYGCDAVVLLHSEGLPAAILDRLSAGLEGQHVAIRGSVAISDASREKADQIDLTGFQPVQAILGLGGGKALDVAKFISNKSQLPFFAIPTSLSNDGFCSPQSSLTVNGRRQSIDTTLPAGVVVDLDVCLQAPKRLWLSGVGDLVSKITAVRDWKRAFHHDGTYVDDFAALLSDSSVYQFIAKPEFDHEGTKRLATALMLNGISMAICGSSRPASGSEHLISHALDQLCVPPHLHGFQVGMATYLISQLYAAETETIDWLFETTGFWPALGECEIRRDQLRDAIRMAPTIKDDFHTILSEDGQIERLLVILENDRRLRSLLC